MNEQLCSLREEIDRVDEQLLPLIVKRMQLVLQVADVKKDRGLPVYDPVRELAILDRVEEKAGKAFGPYAREIYQKVLEMSRLSQAERLKDHAD